MGGQVPRPNELGGTLTWKVANGQGKTSEKAATGSTPVFSIGVLLSTVLSYQAEPVG